MVIKSYAPTVPNHDSPLATEVSQDEIGKKAFTFSGSAAASGNPQYIIVEGSAVSFYWQQLYVEMWFHVTTVMNLMYGLSPYTADYNPGAYLDNDSLDKEHGNDESHYENAASEQNSKSDNMATAWQVPKRSSKTSCRPPPTFNVSTSNRYEDLDESFDHNAGGHCDLHGSGTTGTPATPSPSKAYQTCAAVEDEFDILLLEHAMISHVESVKEELCVDWNDVRHTHVVQAHPSEDNIEHLIKLRRQQLPRKPPYSFFSSEDPCIYQCKSDCDKSESDSSEANTSSHSDQDRQEPQSAEILRQLAAMNAAICKSKSPTRDAG